MRKNAPLYYAIKEDIKKKIQDNLYEFGEVLPTENELCQAYQVSRVTIRKALDALISEDVLIRDFGKRAVVKALPLSRDLNRLSSLQEELEKAGSKCSSYVLHSEVMEVPPNIAEKMALSANKRVFYIERLRYADGIPLCYQQLYLNYDLCSGLDVTLLASSSLYATLEKKEQLTIFRATQSIQAVQSTYRVAALLELPNQVSMLQINRTAYTDQEICFEYSETQYISNRYNLTMTLWR